MKEPVNACDTRIWMCEGHRPAYDSAPLASGIKLKPSEVSTLRNLIMKYMKKCKERREKEFSAIYLKNANGPNYAV
jgi:hypothetical protein